MWKKIKTLAIIGGCAIASAAAADEGIVGLVGGRRLGKQLAEKLRRNRTVS